MPLLATQMHELIQCSFGLEENQQLLRTFLKRKSRRSSEALETGLTHSHHDRWLISAPKQHDAHRNPFKHTRANKTRSLRNPDEPSECCVYRVENTHTPISQTGNASGTV